ncbi:MAG TPA: hypothetical protein VJU18_09140 [Vicinamibacteria bacterium]|nr:hypothetical protein [Vicinamibacteria bacterium]
MRMKVLLAVGFAGLLGLSAYAHEGMKKDCSKKDAAATADGAKAGHCDRKDKDKAAMADCCKDGKCEHKKDGAAECCKKAAEKAADKPATDKP